MLQLSYVFVPTYDYRCQRTGQMFEKWQSFGDTALSTCILVHDEEGEPCGAPVKRVFSKVGISFKGEGFYKNDHGANARARASEKSKSDSSSSDADTSKSDSSSSKADSKTDAKTDSASSSNGSKDSAKSSPKDSSKDSKASSASNAA